MPDILFDKEKIVERVGDIKTSLQELEVFGKMDLKEFLEDRDNYNLACFHLRIAIEATLIIATHILSRMPLNGKNKDYTQTILSLSDYGVLPKETAQKMKGMAGYRNRLVHLYWKVEPKEILEIIKSDLADFEVFIDYIKKFLENK
jgi:uncharacterized protein YutE (UPF0331/DUF86 family)